MKKIIMFLISLLLLFSCKKNIENNQLTIFHAGSLSVPFKEIAEETNVSINTALGRMRYALINLRKLIEEKELRLTLS